MSGSHFVCSFRTFFIAQMEQVCRSGGPCEHVALAEQHELSICMLTLTVVAVQVTAANLQPARLQCQWLLALQPAQALLARGSLPA